MKRSLTTVAIIALCSTQLRADVRVKSTMSVEGGPAAMMGGLSPSVMTHIKGSKSRTDIVVGTQTTSTIMDVEAKELVVLNSADKTARIITADKATAVPGGFTMPKIDATLKPTGQAKVIDGARCDEHVFTVSMSMAEMAASPKMPPEAVEMMKDMRMLMSGSMWLAKSGPGVAEYTAFQTASMKQSMAALLRAVPGMGSSGFDRLMESFSGASGLPYLTEMTMVIEGGGEVAAMMKQLGAMKMTNKVTEVSTEALADDLFKVPADYKIIR